MRRGLLQLVERLQRSGAADKHSAGAIYAASFKFSLQDIAQLARFLLEALRPYSPRLRGLHEQNH